METVTWATIDGARWRVLALNDFQNDCMVARHAQLLVWNSTGRLTSVHVSLEWESD